MRYAIGCLVAGLAATLPLTAAEPFVIDDFEAGTGRWQRVEGKRPDGVGSLVTISPTADTKEGDGAGRLRFVALPGTWAHVQTTVRPGEWLGLGCEAIRLWIRGDGSGETLNVMFGNYEVKPALNFRAPVKLDFTGWREVVLPFEGFQPAGLAGALRQIVLLQLNAGGTKRAIDIVIDEIAALPKAGAAGEGRFHPLDLATGGVWESRADGPVVVDPLGGVKSGMVVPRVVHGVRNHRDLHNPVEFRVDYGEAGTFGVNVGDTSGWGGSRLLVSLDGREVLRRDFPGTSEKALTENRGWYTVPVPAGRHTLRVDNDGADWFMAEGYRFGNYRSVGAQVRRRDGNVQITLARPEDAQRLTVTASLAGRPVAVKTEAPGILVAQLPPASEGVGWYPCTVRGAEGGHERFRIDLRVLLKAPRVRAMRIAFPAGEAVELPVRCANRADVPISGFTSVTVRLGDLAAKVLKTDEGLYVAHFGQLPEGVHEAQVTVGEQPPRPVRFIVYRPGAPVPGGLVGLGRDGWFRTADGRLHLPWGYATIGIFNADPAVAEAVPGEHAWARVDEAALRDWMALLRCYGVNCVRFGVTVDARSLGGDQGGHADPVIIAGLKRLLDVLGPLGMRAVPVMWWGHYRNFGYQGIPAYDKLIGKQADWFTNPAALKLQQQYVREVVAPFKDDPRVLAWEVMNETYRAGSDLDASVTWTNRIIEAIREVDTRHLTTTSAAEATPAPEVRWIRGTRLDFFNWHVYPTYPDYGSWTKLVGPGGPRELGVYTMTLGRTQRLGGKVSLLGECGNDRLTELSYPEFRALITRDSLWLAFLTGSPGGISWDAIADLREFDLLSKLAAQVPWDQDPPAVPKLSARVTDLDQDTLSLARWSQWSLRTGVPYQVVGAGEAPTARLAADGPPADAPAAALAVSTGFECASTLTRSGAALLGYVRNVGEVLPQNVRTRTARPLVLTLNVPSAGKLEVWDLDTRQCVRSASVAAQATVQVGQTDHDYAVLWRR